MSVKPQFFLSYYQEVQRFISSYCLHLDVGKQ